MWMLSWQCPWISLDDGFLTQVLETSDHLKRNAGKGWLFHTESTWHVYVGFRDLHRPAVFWGRSGGDGRKIITSSEGAAWRKTKPKKIKSMFLTPHWLLHFSFAMCCPGTAVGSSERTRLRAHKGSATRGLWPNGNSAAIYCVAARGLPLLCLQPCLT